MCSLSLRWGAWAYSVVLQVVTVMSNSGFAPDWVMLDKEIRTKVAELKDEILVLWNRCGPYPMSHSRNAEWKRNLLGFHKKV